MRGGWGADGCFVFLIKNKQVHNSLCGPYTILEMFVCLLSKYYQISKITLVSLTEVYQVCFEVMGSNPVGASEFFLSFICNCLSYFTTAKISFTCILYPQFTHVISIIYTSKQWMTWTDTDCKTYALFRWKIKWRLEHLGALGIMGG